MKKNFLQKVALTTVLSAILPITTAYAADKSAVTTHDGTSINHKLNVQWQPVSNDNATASSSWDGKSGHSLGVILHYKTTATGSYTLVDGAMNAKSVTLQGSKPSVWTYKSEHYVYHVNGSSVSDTFVQTTLTDW